MEVQISAGEHGTGLRDFNDIAGGECDASRESQVDLEMRRGEIGEQKVIRIDDADKTSIGPPERPKGRAELAHIFG